MIGVNSRTMVIILAAGTDECPTTLLLLQVETGCVGEEKQGQNHATETEPCDDVELLRRRDVVVHNGSHEGTEFTASSRETVGSGTDGGRIDLCSDEESNRVGTELIEE